MRGSRMGIRCVKQIRQLQPSLWRPYVYRRHSRGLHEKGSSLRIRIQAIVPISRLREDGRRLAPAQ